MVDPSGKEAPPTGEVARIQLPNYPSLERSGHHDCYSPSGAEQTSGSDP